MNVQRIGRIAKKGAGAYDTSEVVMPAGYGLFQAPQPPPLPRPLSP